MKLLVFLLALVEDLQHIQPALCKWGESEPQLVKGLEAIGLAATTCSESEIKLIDKHRHNISVVLIYVYLIQLIFPFKSF